MTTAVFLRFVTVFSCLLLAGTIAAALSVEDCPVGWTYFYGDSCYYFETTQTVDWNTARVSCQQKYAGADLIVYSNINETKVISEKTAEIDPGHAWIGIQNATVDAIQGELNFTWINGQPVTQETSKWEFGQPDGKDTNNIDVSNELCISLRLGGKKSNTIGVWRDNGCHETNGYICELILVEATTSPVEVLNLNLSCFENCGKKVSLSSSLLVGTDCLNCPFNVTVKYEWLLYNTNTAKFIDMESSFFTSTGTKSRNLKIKSNQLQPGTQYRLITRGFYNESDGDRMYLGEGSAEWTFMTNLPPYDGSCLVSPDEGFALETSFNVTCSGWLDEGELATYPEDPALASTDLDYAIYTRKMNTTHLSLISYGNSSFSPEIIMGTGTYDIVVRVIDRFGGYQEASGTVVVKPPKDLTKQLENLQGDDNVIERAIKEGKKDTGVTIMNAYCNTLNDQGVPSDPASAKQRMDAKTKISKSVYGIASSATSPASTTQAVDSVALLVEKPEEIDQESQSNVADSVGSISKKLLEGVVGITSDETNDVAAACFRSNGKLQESSSPENIQNRARRRRDVGEEDSFDFEADKAFQEKSKESNSNLGLAVLITMVGGEEDVVVDGGPFQVSLVKDNPIGKQINSGSGASFKMPSSDLDCSEAGFQLMDHQKSPYSWNNQSIDIDNGVQGLDMNCQGQKLEVDGLEEEISLQVPLQPSQWPPEIVANVSTDTGMYIQKIEVNKPEVALCIILNPAFDSDFIIYFRFGEKPTLEEYNLTTVLPRREEDIPENIDRNLVEYTYCVGQENVTKTGFYYIGVMPSEGEWVSNFTMQVFAARCIYWDDKIGDDGSWSQEGVKVSTTETTIEAITCLTTHLTDFATEMFVPPNSIDFSSVFAKFKNLSDNAAVFSTVVSIFGIYIISIIFARRADKKDLIKWGVTPLADNHPSDTHFYQIIVHTASGTGAGTKSKVFCTVTGTEGNSGTRKLEDDQRPLFQRGSICHFLMGVPESLGALKYFRVWHDNSGKGDNASWLVDKIEVVDLQTTDRSTFLCKKWLAVEKEDGVIDRQLSVANEKELITFANLFGPTARKEFSEGHLWISVLSRPSPSSFTRVQRISVCLSLLFLTMIANCMFFKSEDEQAAGTNDKLFAIGPIQFTLKQFYISIVSTLVVFPPSIIIVTFFKKSRPKNNETQQKVLSNLKKMKKEKLSKKKMKKSKNYLRFSESGSKMASTWGILNYIQNKGRKANKVKVVVEDFSQVGRGGGGVQGGGRSFYGDDEIDSNCELESTADTEATSLPSLHSSSDLHFPYIGSVMEDPMVKPAEKKEKKERKKVKKPWMLPHWCTYIAWALVVLSSVASGFFTILYSMEWGKEKANEWLITFLLSFFENLLLVQPLKVVCLALILSFIFKKPQQEEILDTDLNSDEEWLHQNSSKSERVDRPPPPPIDDQIFDEEYLEKAKERRQREVMITGTLRECVIYALYLTALLMIAYGAKDPSTHWMHEDMDNIFFQNWQYEKIDGGLEGYFIWAREALIPGLYADESLNGERLDKNERKFAADYYSYRVGPPRVRQLRVRPDLCKTPKTFRNMAPRCNVGYSSTAEDHQSYLPFWMPVEGNSSLPGDDDDQGDFSQVWRYQTEDELDGLSVYATTGTYGGGGYAVELGSTIEAASDTLQYLYDSKWLDYYTRAVITEFSVYNANKNIFGVIMVVSELPVTGGGIRFQTIDVVRLYSFGGTFPEFLIGCHVVFVFFVVYYFIREVREMKKLKCKYFKSWWSIFELVIIGLSVFVMAMFAYKTMSRLETLAVLEEDKPTGGEGEWPFINLHQAVIYEQIFTTIIAFVVFFSILKFMKLLRLNRHISLLVATLHHAMGDMVSFIITLGIVIAAFSQMAYLLFSAEVFEFSTFITTVETMFGMLLGDFDYYAMVAANEILGPLFFLVYTLSAYMMLINIFVTGVMISYAIVKEEEDKKGPQYEIIDFIWDMFMSIVGQSSSNTLLPKKKEQLKSALEKEDSAPYDISHLLSYDKWHLRSVSPSLSMDEGSSLEYGGSTDSHIMEALDGRLDELLEYLGNSCDPEGNSAGMDDRYASGKVVETDQGMLIHIPQPNLAPVVGQRVSGKAYGEEAQALPTISGRQVLLPSLRPPPSPRHGGSSVIRAAPMVLPPIHGKHGAPE